MIFRCTRNTNDTAGWVTACLFACITSAIAITTYIEVEAIDQLCIGGLGILLMGAINVFLFSEVLFPRQLELIVDEDSIRCMQMRRGSEQKQLLLLLLCDIKSLHVNHAEREVHADTGRWFLCPISPNHFTKTSLTAFLKFMAEQHPEIPIDDPNVNSV